MVDDLFSHWEYYTVLTVDQHNQITGRETVPSPQGCGCKSGIAARLEKMGVGFMLAGNMGQGAFNVPAAPQIKVARGCAGNIRYIATAYLEDKISDSGIGCTYHERHECNHDHHHDSWYSNLCGLGSHGWGDVYLLARVALLILFVVHILLHMNIVPYAMPGPDIT